VVLDYDDEGRLSAFPAGAQIARGEKTVDGDPIRTVDERRAVGLGTNKLADEDEHVQLQTCGIECTRTGDGPPREIEDPPRRLSPLTTAAAHERRQKGRRAFSNTARAVFCSESGGRSGMGTVRSIQAWSRTFCP